jgi:hypothetical protein
MSFGFGVSDFLNAFQLAQRVRQSWVDAPGEYESLCAEYVEVFRMLGVQLSNLSVEILTQLKDQEHRKYLATNRRFKHPNEH